MMRPLRGTIVTRFMCCLALLVFAGTNAEAGMMGSGGMMGRGAQQPSAGEPATKLPSVVQGYCGVCHAVPRPDSHTAQEWPSVVRRMEGYMRAQGRAVPSNSDERAILAYLERPQSDGR